MRFVWFAVFLFLFAFVAGAPVNSFEGIGYVDLQFENKTYQPGELVPFSLVVQNADSVPFSEGRVVVHLAKVGSPRFALAVNDVYGSTENNPVPDFFVSEMVFKDLKLASGQTRVLNASFPLPQEMKNGDYAFYVYLSDGRTPVLGNEVLFAPGQLKRFTVSGSSGRAVYVDFNSSVEGQFDQAGPTINASTVSGLAEVTNDAPFTRKNVSLRLRVFKWNAYDEPPIFENVLQVPPIAPNSTTVVPYSFKKPVQPYAYALRFDVLEFNQSRSFYDLRFVSPGNGGRVVRLNPLSLSMKKGAPFAVAYAVVGSADGKAINPAVVLKVDAGGKEIYSNSTVVNGLNVGGKEVEHAVESFVSTESSDQFTLTVELRGPGNALLDSYSKAYNAADYSGGTVLPTDFNAFINSTDTKNGRKALNSSTNIMFYSTKDFQGVLCTNALVTVSGEGGSFTLYSGVLENRAETRFANVDRLPAGDYEFKVKCFNANDLHQTQLSYAENVFLAGALAPKQPTPTLEPSLAPLPSTPAGRQKETNWLLIVGSLILLLALLGLFFFFKRGENQ